MLQGEKSITVAASPDAVWKLIADVEGYPDWHPFFASVEVSARDGRDRVAEARCSHPTPAGTLHTEMAFTYAEGGHVQAERHGGDTKSLVGVFLIAPDGDGTKVTHRIKVDPGMRLGLLLKGPVEERVRRSVLDGALDRLAERATAGS